jgi:hypothetical protein
VPAASFEVASEAKDVPLTATASGSGQLTYSWLKDGVAFNSNLNTTFQAPKVTVDTKIVFTIQVTGCDNKKASATVTVTVKAPAQTAAPVLNPIAPQTVASGTPVTMTVSGNAPSGYLYVWTQTGGPAPQTVVKNTSSTYKFTRSVPIGQITNDVLSFSVVANSPAGVTPAVSSNAVTTTVTVKPQPDVDTITTAVYRTSKSRLDLTATSSVVNPGLTLTLQPYLTITGTTFDPTGLGSVLTNTGGGNYTMTLVGAPQPAAGAQLVVTSNIGGASPKTALTLLRN